MYYINFKNLNNVSIILGGLKSIMSNNEIRSILLLYWINTSKNIVVIKFKFASHSLSSPPNNKQTKKEKQTEKIDVNLRF